MIFNQEFYVGIELTIAKIGPDTSCHIYVGIYVETCLIAQYVLPGVAYITNGGGTSTKTLGDATHSAVCLY